MADETLGREDYAALHAMLMDGDPQGAMLAKKLTSSEQQAFFDYQKQANAGKGERTREDNNLLGMPPELVIASGVPIARAVASAGASLASKVGAAATSTASQIVAPQAKYWATKAVLTKMGVPSILAEGAALAVSGYKKGAKAETTAMASEPATVQGVSVDALRKAGVGEAAIQKMTAAPAVEPVASAPATPAPRAAPTAGAGVQLPPAVAPPSAPLTAKPSLLAAESKEYMRLLKSGKSHQQAMELIAAQRAFAQRMGLPSAADVRGSVAERNIGGSWPE